MEVKNLDKLAKVVTDNIFEKLDFKTDFKISDKSCLILVPNIGLGFKEYLNFIIKNYPNNDLYLGSSEEFSKTYHIENNRNLKFINFDIKNSEFINILDAVETIIILGLKINQLKALSETDDLDDINHIILESLMSNKSINIMINTNGLMFNKIANIVYEIRNIGINVTNIQQSNVSALNDIDLITESYVLNLRENGLKSLIMSRKQLITPLAKDKLREFKIGIEYNEEAK
ncbi:MAG: Nucleotide utilization protein [Candidatus Izimaplasma bacterium HR2]|nr:MAG: Nucleotide utilization protein [Candidatus Izimaplasma bacterium HR2]